MSYTTAKGVIVEYQESGDDHEHILIGTKHSDQRMIIELGTRSSFETVNGQSVLVSRLNLYSVALKLPGGFDFNGHRAPLEKEIKRLCTTTRATRDLLEKVDPELVRKTIDDILND